MELELIGPHPLERDAQGRQLTRIGTLFLEPKVLFTQGPGVHAWQRLAFADQLNARRAGQGLAPLTAEEEEQLASNSVDLIFDPDHILIRPDPARMALMFAADELLQSLVSKRSVRFLMAADPRVGKAIKERGESWRLSSIPKTREAKERLVLNSKVGIHGRAIYFYNRLTGTRWLTCQGFASLADLDDTGLALHLQEIADHSNRRNRLGLPEVDFFAVDLRRFGAAEFAGPVFVQLTGEALRAKFAELKTHFASAVHETFRKDDPRTKAWLDRMLFTLFLEGNESENEQVLSGLSREFFLQVEWLAGGRFEEGEFLFDAVFEEAAGHPDDTGLQRLCDPRARGIIFNLIRDFGDLEWINVGCVPESLSLERPQQLGRRGVYLAEFQARNEQTPRRRFMRLQKWGVWEHLDQGKDLLQAIEESDEYTDYWLDRRLGCRQLGMNLTHRVAMRRLSEKYQGANEHHRAHAIHTTYFERDYLPGIATDKLPPEKCAQPAYAARLAELLGRAAASSMIVGRALDQGRRAVFDDGDELVQEGEDGVPAQIMVGDHSGAFGEYQLPLAHFAGHYARPVNAREAVLAQPQEFARQYLAAFREQFLHVQGDYRKRRRAFDSLFSHCKYDPRGSFAFRWECVLRRLDQTDPDELVKAIAREIRALNGGSTKS